MTTHTVLQFMRKTADDTMLQRQLEQLLGCGDGDISSSVNLDPEESLALSQRAPKVVELATSMGYSFSSDELLLVIDAFRKHQDGTISDQAFANLLGMSQGEQVRPAVSNNFKRIANYLTKTYLGVNLTH